MVIRPCIGHRQRVVHTNPVRHSAYTAKIRSLTAQGVEGRFEDFDAQRRPLPPPRGRPPPTLVTRLRPRRAIVTAA